MPLICERASTRAQSTRTFGKTPRLERARGRCASRQHDACVTLQAACGTGRAVLVVAVSICSNKKERSQHSCITWLWRPNRAHRSRSSGAAIVTRGKLGRACCRRRRARLCLVESVPTSHGQWRDAPGAPWSSILHGRRARCDLRSSSSGW